MFFFLRCNGIKVWVALVRMFFDHHMQVVTDVQLRRPQLKLALLFLQCIVSNFLCTLFIH